MPTLFGVRGRENALAMKKLEKKLKRLLNYINPAQHKRYKMLVSDRELGDLPSVPKLAVFKFSSDFWHDDMGRYAYTLVKAFVNAGYSVALTPEFSFLSRLDKYKRFLLSEEFGVVDMPDLAKDSIFLRSGNSESIFKVIKPKAGQSPRFSSKVKPIPYMMHPVIYHRQMERQLAALRTGARRHEVLFAGKVNHKGYKGGAVQYVYHKIPRFQVINFLTNTLNQDEVINVTDADQLGMQKASSTLTVVDADNFKIEAQDWLGTLRNFAFFLACPGSDMPMCHNVIEAMAVGSIPLLEYPEYFHPPLQSGVNCIAFQGQADLLTQLLCIKNMREDEVSQLREGVISYYEQYLVPRAWVERLAQDHKITTLVFDAWKIKS